jgi:naphthalene 1,2-dioxygenase ferredoxin component
MYLRQRDDPELDYLPNMSDLNSWMDVTSEDDLFEGMGIAYSIQGHEIGLFKLEDGVYAIDNICTHGHAKLCDGFVDGYMVECPFHQARFDVRDGSVTCGPATEPVKSWPIKIENGRVFLQGLPL